MSHSVSPRLASMLTVFSLVFPVVYVVLYYNEVAFFRFYPLVGELHLNIQPTTFGPAMIYYGWIVMAAIAAALTAVAVPHRWTLHLWAGWSWVVPVAATLFTFAYETRWLLH
jgi:hypothetical protein